MSESPFTEADRLYIRRQFVDLRELCLSEGASLDVVHREMHAGRLPKPSYVVDGVEYVPRDYFRPLHEAGGIDRLEAEFKRRYCAAGGSPSDAEETWRGYLTGIYAVCVSVSSPEAIAAKHRLITAIDALLANPLPDDPSWCDDLRRCVDGLDLVERPFAPDYDRSDRFPEPPTRDRYITELRRRYGHAFSADVALTSTI